MDLGSVVLFFSQDCKSMTVQGAGVVTQWEKLLLAMLASQIGAQV